MSICERKEIKQKQWRNEYCCKLLDKKTKLNRSTFNAFIDTLKKLETNTKKWDILRKKNTWIKSNSHDVGPVIIEIASILAFPIKSVK